MGVCCSNSVDSMMNMPEKKLLSFVQTRIMENIDYSDFKLLDIFEKENVNKAILSIYDTKINALAFSIITNDIVLMKMLYSRLGASFEQTEFFLIEQNSSIFELIISNYNQEILKFYLPLYLKSNHSVQIAEIEYTLTFNSVSLPSPIKKFHPMRLATEKPCIEFLSYIQSYFKTQEIPKEFDINDIDEETGENCPLIACRELNLNLIVYFYRIQGNFFIKNKRQENALQIALKSGQLSDETLCYSVIVFLIDVVRIDITENYEENLLIAKHINVIEFIEERLLREGIKSTKRQVEEKYAVNDTGSDAGSLKNFQEIPLSTISSIFAIDEISIFSEITFD
ncbi:hypothetical protein SteCoe_4924 [Stentor coeruleus]|uniref:Uncharacterized protein n=1 Tax=Stentor coeruleus TaxID=5963 RepID=A0A1R2CTR3_9CILI|nr:hypothetical protein SteCoe_4924 [Stentor coeruleus]